ncbi:MAG: hypothetical protein KDK40_04175, partial [Chlamydiia bacterium]|nr:hypothetical protein [Chlamydiia bacterium]
WDHETYGSIVKNLQLSDTDAKTLNLIWQNSPHHVDHLNVKEMDRSLQESIDAILSRNNGYQGSLMDLAAKFRNESNENVAIAWVNSTKWKKPPKAVIYYDENNQRMLFNRLTQNKHTLKTSSELESLGLTKEDLVVFWDYAHTTGVNELLAYDAKATLIFGKFVKLRDLLQTVWRLRGLDKGQKVDFVVMEDYDHICQRLNLPLNTQLTIGHLQRYAFQLQIETLKRNLERAAFRQLRSVLVKSAVELLLDPKSDPKDIVKIFIGLQELFVTSTNPNPSISLGKAAQLIDTYKVIENEVKRLKSSKAMTFLRNHSKSDRSISIEKIENEIDILGNQWIAILPEQLISQERSVEKLIEIFTQNENQQNKQSEVNKESELNREIQYRFPNTNPRTSVEWNKDILFRSDSYFTFENTALGKVKNHPISVTTLPIYRFHQFPKSQFLTTINLFPQSNQNNTYEYIPYGVHQKPVQHSLIAVDRTHPSRIAIVTIDQREDALINRWILEENYRPSEEHQVDLLLMHLSTGQISRRTANPLLNVTALKINPQFITQFAQAKFSAGLLSYSPQELDALKSWMTDPEVGVEKMYLLFKDTILLHKTDTRGHFSNAELGIFFEGLRNLNQPEEKSGDFLAIRFYNGCISYLGMTWNLLGEFIYFVLED